MKLLQEFKTFAMRGSVIDLSVGIVIGAAFTAIVTSLVGDILTPLLGLALGNADFKDYFLILKGEGAYATLVEAQEAGAVTLNYGLFGNAVLKFLVVGLALFFLIRQINALVAPRKPETPSSPPAPPENILLLREIRDLLKAKT